MLAGLKKNLKIYWLGIVLTPFFIVGLFFYFSRPEGSLLSPLGKDKTSVADSTEKLEVIAFLPYWNLAEVKGTDFYAIDQLIYFGLKPGPDGEIVKMTDEGLDIGWQTFEGEELRQIFTRLKSGQKKILISIASFEREVMDQLLADPGARQKLTSQLVELVVARDLDGLNIDFEYLTEWEGENFGKNFHQFLQELKIALKSKKPSAILSVDIYPKAFVYNWPYKLEEMNQIVDQVILMAYDFTQINSPQSGPVAPLRAEDDREHSIIRTLSFALAKIEPQKLILGIPLYGYEWQTVSSQERSHTYPRSGLVATLKRVKELIREKKVLVNWDRLAATPWLTYEDNEVVKQIYFENLQSLGLKVDLAKQLKLAGVAFWALGYEGEDEEVWRYLESRL